MTDEPEYLRQTHDTNRDHAAPGRETTPSGAMMAAASAPRPATALAHPVSQRVCYKVGSGTRRKPIRRACLPYRLRWLETLVRLADGRASREEAGESIVSVRT